jgi:hypothetical protein
MPILCCCCFPPQLLFYPFHLSSSSPPFVLCHFHARSHSHTEILLSLLVNLSHPARKMLDISSSSFCTVQRGCPCHFFMPLNEREFDRSCHFPTPFFPPQQNGHRSFTLKTNPPSLFWLVYSPGEEVFSYLSREFHVSPTPPHPAQTHQK